jgi:hypothetical protein
MKRIALNIKFLMALVIECFVFFRFSCETNYLIKNNNVGMSNSKDIIFFITNHCFFIQFFEFLLEFLAIPLTIY